MKRFSLAIVATAGLVLASCGSNEDTINEVDVNAAQTDELNDLSSAAANDAANSLEMETLGNQANQLDTQNQLSEVEGVDLPAAIVEMQLQEVAYQAALGATAKALQPTLMDFLR